MSTLPLPLLAIGLVNYAGMQNFEHNGSQINVSIIEHNGCVLGHSLRYRKTLGIYCTVRRVVCTGISHVITSLISRLSHTVQYMTGSRGGAWVQDSYYHYTPVGLGSMVNYLLNSKKEHNS